jgi:ribonucleotide reductase beta subunit family protein with ferritin-like domain
VDSVARKTGWLGKYVYEAEHVSIQLVGLAIALALFQSSLMDLLMHVAKEDHLMSGLVHAIAKIKHDRDQFVHFCHIVRSHVVNTVPETLIKQLVRDAVSMEMQMVDELKQLSIGQVTIQNTNVEFEEIKNRVAFRADILLRTFGCPAMFGVPDSLTWIEVIYQKELKLDQPVLKVQKPKAAPKPVEQQALSFDADF